MYFYENFKTMSKYNVKSKVGTIIPDWIVEKMLDEQEKQSGERDVTVFEKNPYASIFDGEDGFSWHNSKDEYDYWDEIINKRKYPEEPKKYPRVMLISDSTTSWCKRVVEFEKKIGDETLYFAWDSAETIEDSLKSRILVTWRFAKEIEPETPKQIELTLDEIADKFGVSVENLKIKK